MFQIRENYTPEATEQHSVAVELEQGEAGFWPEHLLNYDQSAALESPFEHMSKEAHWQQKDHMQADLVEGDEQEGEGEVLDGEHGGAEGCQVAVHHALFFEQQCVHVEGYLEGFLA